MAEAMSERILIFLVCIRTTKHWVAEALSSGTPRRDASLYWLIVTVPHAPQWSAEVGARKAKEIERVAEAYGVKKTYKLGFPTAKLETVSQES